MIPIIILIVIIEPRKNPSLWLPSRTRIIERLPIIIATIENKFLNIMGPISLDINLGNVLFMITYYIV